MTCCINIAQALINRGPSVYTMSRRTVIVVMLSHQGSVLILVHCVTRYTDLLYHILLKRSLTEALVYIAPPSDSNSCDAESLGIVLIFVQCVTRYTELLYQYSSSPQ